MRKINKKFGILLVIAVLTLGLIAVVSASLFTTNVQTTQPAFTTYYSSKEIADYWPDLSEAETCEEARQDFILNVRPGGCSPAVVRSDLLEEQNECSFRCGDVDGIVISV